MRLTIWSAALLLAATLGARAQKAPPPDPRGAFGLILENDAAFSPLDPWYTSGLRLGWTSREDALPSPLASLDRQLSDGQGHAARSRWGLALGQRIYTPEDTALRDPDPRDRPYAGYLYGAVFLNETADGARARPGGAAARRRRPIRAGAAGAGNDPSRPRGPAAAGVEPAVARRAGLRPAGRADLARRAARRGGGGRPPAERLARPRHRADLCRCRGTPPRRRGPGRRFQPAARPPCTVAGSGSEPRLPSPDEPARRERQRPPVLRAP
jgi:hypothetical protein